MINSDTKTLIDELIQNGSSVENACSFYNVPVEMYKCGKTVTTSSPQVVLYTDPVSMTALQKVLQQQDWFLLEAPKRNAQLLQATFRRAIVQDSTDNTTDRKATNRNKRRVVTPQESEELPQKENSPAPRPNALSLKYDLYMTAVLLEMDGTMLSTPQDIASALGMLTSRVYYALKRAMALGFVFKEGHPAYYGLTEKGQALKEDNIEHREYLRSISESEVGPKPLLVLKEIQRSPNSSIAELSDALGTTPPNVYNHTNFLAQKLLIRMSRKPSTIRPQRGVKTFSITHRGAQLLKREK